MPTPPAAGARWKSMSSDVTRPRRLRPSYVAALMTRFRKVIGPSVAGAKASGAGGRPRVRSTTRCASCCRGGGVVDADLEDRGGGRRRGDEQAVGNQLECGGLLERVVDHAELLDPGRVEGDHGARAAQHDVRAPRGAEGDVDRVVTGREGRDDGARARAAVLRPVDAQQGPGRTPLDVAQPGNDRA